MSFYHPIVPFDLRGKTLVVPVVSAANIAQLAADLLIASLSLHLVGVFDSRDLVPVVGGREDGEEGVSTPLELFGKEGCDVAVIQQRSPVLLPRKQEFIDALLQFLRDSKFSSSLFLSGVDMSDRTDAQMITPTYYIRPSNSPPWENSPLASISQLPIPEYSSPVSQYPPVLLLRRTKGRSLSSPVAASRGGSSITSQSPGTFRQLRCFSSCSKVTTGPTRRSWLRWWPKCFHWRCKSGGNHSAGSKGCSEPLMTRPCMVDAGCSSERAGWERILYFLYSSHAFSVMRQIWMRCNVCGRVRWGKTRFICWWST